MRDVFIKYNPYKVETSVEIDGKPVKKGSPLVVDNNVRLQEWIEELPKFLKDECNTMSFHVTFQGTLLDFEDLQSVLIEAKGNGFEFNCTHVKAKEVSDKEKSIEEIFEKIQRGPFEELRQPDMTRAFKEAQSSEFPVNVIATMSAGKSTLINALLRQKLMPAKNEACTATITELKDSDNEVFRASVYDKDGNLIISKPEITLSEMEQLNANPEVSTIRAEGDIPFVSSEDVALVLVDTPGPNNSRDPEHKAATYRMLSESSKPLVLYILNATQLAVNDDNNLLNHVAESMKVGGKQSRDRFIFVVNKLDDFKKGEDSVSSAIEKVRKYLEDKGIQNPNIFPASALTALNIRTLLRDTRIVGYSEDELDELDPEVFCIISTVKRINNNEELHLEQYAPLTPSGRGDLLKSVAAAKGLTESNDDEIRSEGMKQLALIHSGVVPIESAIRTYVLKYAKTKKIKSIVDTFAKKLESAKSFEKTREIIATNQEKKNEILQQIYSINEKLQSGEDAKAFKKEIDALNYDKEIQALVVRIVKTAQERIQEQITGSKDKKWSKTEAGSMCKTFGEFSNDLQAEVQVKLEEMITNQMAQNAKQLLEKYKQRISSLSGDLGDVTISINAFELLDGDISTMGDVSTMISSYTKKERVKVGSHKEHMSDCKWYKPWTWAKITVNDYEDHEYVDGGGLADKFFAPLQEQLVNNQKSAIAYAKEQAKIIKAAFEEKFAELNCVLAAKLDELKKCASNEKDVDQVLDETQRRLSWLEGIQEKIEAILEI